MSEEDFVPYVEHGIPIPEVISQKGGTKYPWLLLEVGDSFVVPKTHFSGLTRANRTYAPKRFVSKKLSKQGKPFHRIWRVE